MEKTPGGKGGSMKELQTSNHLLGDSEALGEAIRNEGYVFFRDVIDPTPVEHVKRGVMAWFESQGVVEVVDDEPRFVGGDPGEFGEHPPSLYDTHLWEWLAFRPELQRFQRRLFGENAHVLPMGEYQFTWPGRPDCLSRVHQDGPYNPGVDFVVEWIPLMPVPEDLGGLAIVPTAQSCGSLQPSFADTPDSPLIPFIPFDSFPEGSWHRSDYEPGDVLVFGPFTPHCGLPNQADRLRLSVDLRVQPVSSKRPCTGVVLAAEGDSVVIAADDGREVRLSVDNTTAMPLMDRKSLIGRRVLAAADSGHATLIRNQRGHVPWSQTAIVD
jgi:hypothetical protein